MTNTELFLKTLKEKNMTQAELAEKIGMKRQTLSLKIHNVREFFPSHINKICEVLEITDKDLREAIFFAA